MVDRILARLYTRLGPSMLWLVPVWGALVGAFAVTIVVLAGWRYFDTTPLTMLLACAGWLVVDVTIGGGILWRARHDLGPALASADALRTPEQAAEACHALVDARRVARGYCWTLIALTPLHAATFTIVLDQPWWFTFPAMVAALTAIGGVITALTAAIDVLQRPVRKAVFVHLPPDFELHERRTALILQPITLSPIPTLIAALVVGAFSNLGGDGVGRFAIAAGIGVLLVVSISLVVTLRAIAWVTPIEDLIAAATRVEDGDLSASIPVVGSDETGTLAHHFNAMLVGLRERESLRTDLVDREAELRASRDRIITAGDTERRRVERNLHDGAQQRLVALQLDLRLLEDAATVAVQPHLSALAAEAGLDLKGALDELRDLARGLHPMVLDSDGLAPAIRQLTDRSTIPATVSVDVERLPSSVEATLYFVASEALANVAKHAAATAVTVRVAYADGDVRLQVTDDGVGGARGTLGSGISSLADRVDAAGGVLRVESHRGAGTTVEATIPVLAAVPVEAAGPVEAAVR